MAVFTQSSSAGSRAAEVLPGELSAGGVSSGDVVQLNAAGKWEPAISDSLGALRSGISLDDGATLDDVIDVQVLGTVGGYPAASFTPGAVLYLSQTVAGGRAEARPGNPNLPVFIVGKAGSDGTSYSLILQVTADGFPSASDFILYECDTTVGIGKIIKLTGEPVSGVWPATICDPSARNKMPGAGIVIATTSTTEGTAQIGGIVSDVLSGLTTGGMYKVSSSADLTLAPSGIGTGVVYQQDFCAAMSPTKAFISQNFSLRVRRL